MKRLPPLALAALLLAGCGYLPSVKMNFPSKTERVEAKMDKIYSRLQKLRQERLVACLKAFRADSLEDIRNASAACQAELLPLIL